MSRSTGFALLAFVAITVGLTILRWSGTPSPAQGRLDNLLDSLASESFREVSLQPEASEALGVDAYRFFEIREGAGLPVWVYAGTYGAMGGDAQIHAPEHCYPGAGYGIVSRSRDEGRAELVVENGSDRRLVWYQYRTGRGSATEAWQLKRDMLLMRLLRRPPEGLLLRLSTPVGPTETTDQARHRLRVVWNQHAVPTLDRFTKD